MTTTVFGHRNLEIPDFGKRQLKRERERRFAEIGKKRERRKEKIRKI